MADWTAPKTNWVNTDRYNTIDYNRQVNNLLFLKDRVEELFGPCSLVAMEIDKNYADKIYARHINTIEQNLTTINALSYNLDIGQETTYVPNGKVPFAAEYNRIESASLSLYKWLMINGRITIHLAFGLGKGKWKGIKRTKYDDSEVIGYRMSMRLGLPKGVKP